MHHSRSSGSRIREQSPHGRCSAFSGFPNDRLSPCTRPPRIQRRYRPGFSPGSLSSPAARTAAEALKASIALSITRADFFVKPPLLWHTRFRVRFVHFWYCFLSFARSHQKHPCAFCTGLLLCFRAAERGTRRDGCPFGSFIPDNPAAVWPGWDGGACGGLLPRSGGCAPA